MYLISGQFWCLDPCDPRVFLLMRRLSDGSRWIFGWIGAKWQNLQCWDLFELWVLHILHNTCEFSVFLRGSDTDILYRYIHTCGFSEKWLLFSSSFLFLFFFSFTIVAHSSVYSLSKKALWIQLKYHNIQVLGCYAPVVLGRAGKEFSLFCVCTNQLFFFLSFRFRV